MRTSTVNNAPKTGEEPYGEMKAPSKSGIQHGEVRYGLAGAHKALMSMIGVEVEGM